MIRVLTPAAARPLRRLGGLVAPLALVIAVAACGGKSEAQLTNDALNAGIAAHTAGNIAEAQRQYNECLKHDIRNKICHYNLGLIAQTSGDAVTAENEYRLSLSADPNYTPALFNLAILRAGLGDTASGIHAVVGILAALLQRHTTGVGQRIEIAQQDVVVNLRRVYSGDYYQSGAPGPRARRRSPW